MVVPGVGSDSYKLHPSPAQNPMVHSRLYLTGA